jgi:hypothetical protein
MGWAYFHIRCHPKDIKSFIRSYDSATLVKTPATRCVFSASVTVSKPKCVGRSGSRGALSEVVVAGVREVREGRVVQKDRAARAAEEGFRDLRRDEIGDLSAGRAAILANRLLGSVEGVLLDICQPDRKADEKFPCMVQGRCSRRRSSFSLAWGYLDEASAEWWG